MCTRKSNCGKKEVTITNSPINVPFSWENSPGVAKASPGGLSSTCRELPPPPVAARCSGTPPPPAAADQEASLQMGNLHVALKSPFKGRVVDKKPGDPFLAAYVKCTASPLSRFSRPEVAPASGGGKGRRRRIFFGVCCMESCSVVEGCNLVRVNKSGK